MESPLDLYQRKLKEAVTLVPTMDFNSQLAAVEYWNNTSSDLQKIVHKSNLSHKQSNIDYDVSKNFNLMQFTAADSCTISGTTDEYIQTGSEVNNMNLSVTNTATTTQPLTNSSGPINQQYLLDRRCYEDIHQEASNLTKGQLEHLPKDQLKSNSHAQDRIDKYGSVSNETLICSLDSLQLTRSDPLISQMDLNSLQNSSNQLYFSPHQCQVHDLASDEQVENSIVDIAADILTSEAYCTINKTIKDSIEYSGITRDDIAPPEELDKMERLIIDGGEEFNNVVTIASSLSSQLPSNILTGGTHESVKLFEDSDDYNVDPQVMSFNQESSAYNINDKISIQNNQTSSQKQLFKSNFSNQARCLIEMENRFTCSKCKQQFESLPELSHHEKLHLSERDSSFSTSGDAGTNPSAVKREVLTAGCGGDLDNLVNNNIQHICDICHKSFSTAGNLKRHRKSHSGIKPFKCDQCESAFTEKKSLVIHLRRHTGERPYKCDICGKLFSQSGVLNSHMALHLNERKFECLKCNKAFRQKSQLKLHLLRHEGVKRLECPTCRARFLVKADLTRHIKIHTGQRNFTCEICDKMFTRKQSLNEHIIRHNGAKPLHSLENSHETNSSNDNFPQVSH